MDESSHAGFSVYVGWHIRGFVALPRHCHGMDPDHAPSSFRRQRKAIPPPCAPSPIPIQPVLPDPSLDVIQQPPQIPTLGEDPVACISLARRINQVVRSFQYDLAASMQDAGLPTQAGDLIRFVPPLDLILQEDAESSGVSLVVSQQIEILLVITLHVLGRCVWPMPTLCLGCDKPPFKRSISSPPLPSLLFFSRSEVSSNSRALLPFGRASPPCNRFLLTCCPKGPTTTWGQASRRCARGWKT